MLNNHTWLFADMLDRADLGMPPSEVFLNGTGLENSKK